MLLRAISNWLWSNRKSLLPAALAVACLELLYYQTSWLNLGLAGILLSLAIGVWWVTAFGLKDKRLWLTFLQLVWVSIGAVGFVIFNLVVTWQFQLTVGLIALLWWWLLSLYESYAANGVWPVRVAPVIDFVDLLAFFFAGGVALLAADFYSLSVWWLVLVFVVQTVFALYLRFWREDIRGLRRWLYALVVVLVSQEIVWISSFWHRGVYLKAFLAAIVFYLMTDFIIHYAKGSLTVKVALEYLGLVFAVLVGVLIVDGFLVLR